MTQPLLNLQYTDDYELQNAVTYFCNEFESYKNKTLTYLAKCEIANKSHDGIADLQLRNKMTQDSRDWNITRTFYLKLFLKYKYPIWDEIRRRQLC